MIPSAPPTSTRPSSAPSATTRTRSATDRQKAGFVGVTAFDAAQATLDATLGNINTPSVWIDPNNGQSYYVVTYYDGATLADPNALAQLPVRIDDEGRAVRLGSYGTVQRAVGPIAIERNGLQRAAHVYMQTEGRDIGTVAKDLENALKKDPKLKVGKVRIKTTIAPSGTVTAAAIDKQKVDESPLGACLKRAMKRIVFPSFSGDAFEVDIPLQVTAGE